MLKFAQEVRTLQAKNNWGSASDTNVTARF